MAPAIHDNIEAQLKEITDTLHTLIVIPLSTQTISNSTTAISSANDPNHPSATATAISTLFHQLITLVRSADHLPLEIPAEIVAYVEDGRNPDIYTREFVESVQKGNQRMRGREQAFAGFRDCLAKEMIGVDGDGEYEDEIKRAVEGTGGVWRDVVTERGNGVEMGQGSGG
ncbi:hypothetical protein K402DRAFT_234146 [Aulographum hederae CBS 113979]|uniref:Mediator of RNA polymerase II transcription subunit 10 n=1 Tax=Aulographum hederae CBS 113979 TaxID=1176131 RepID=A0A6G1GKK2_9PEZI|nr:hypothetical protein K402DRAFT_234146 [Aulographum hederae CBS 113979]